MTDHVLEPAAQALAAASAEGPSTYELGPEGARKLLDDIQAASAWAAGSRTWSVIFVLLVSQVVTGGASARAVRGRLRRAPEPVP